MSSKILAHADEGHIKSKGCQNIPFLIIGYLEKGSILPLKAMKRAVQWEYNA